ncbi:lysozyme [Acinetobacter guillouiae]|uniref:lysozyme n=1 Tax=Acinetobacter guillouiae TaxID=106649 RepID=UPI002FDB6B6F
MCFVRCLRIEFGRGRATMKTSNSGINLIKGFEGLRLKAYDDGVGIWTIGFGTIKYPNGVRVKKGDTCTESQAEEYLRNDLVVFENAINRLVKVPLNQNQFDALLALRMNTWTTSKSSPRFCPHPQYLNFVPPFTIEAGKILPHLEEAYSDINFDVTITPDVPDKNYIVVFSGDHLIFPIILEFPKNEHRLRLGWVDIFFIGKIRF